SRNFRTVRTSERGSWGAGVSPAWTLREARCPRKDLHQHTFNRKIPLPHRGNKGCYAGGTPAPHEPRLF
ncbi:MAG: hypothetical protein IKI05_05880, partial [Bacteroidaceae bacterium]|nr:hypothetical protein [Bacteroidaceae bacterium]